MTRGYVLGAGVSLLGACLIAGCVVEDSAVETIGSSYAPLVTAGPDAVRGQYIVVFRDSASVMSLAAATEQVALGVDSEILHSYSVIPGFAARLGPQALAGIRRNPEVAYVEEDRVIQLSAVHTAGAEGIDRVDQRKLPRDGQFNDFGNTGAGVHVMIIDTGIRATHAEFGDRVGVGFSAIADELGPDDCHGHGTHVASTAAGAQYGVAKGAALHASRVLNCRGSGTTSGVIAGVDWVRTTCVGNGWTCVANMSLGGAASAALDSAVARAVDAGIPFVVAAGNDNKSACSYSPAREASAITVAAADGNDAKASFSNWGACVDIFAPGVAIKGAWKDADASTKSISGTSMASPHVAGAAALYLGANPGASPIQVRDALLGSATVNCVTLANGSPNVLLHNDFSAGQFDCESGESLPPPSTSCATYCGRGAPGGCYCDGWCFFLGDCCSDWVEVCM